MKTACYSEKMPYAGFEHSLSENRVAVITGAAQGIGRTAAELLGSRGYAIVLSDVASCSGTRAALAAAEVQVVEVMVSGKLAVVRDIWRFTTAAGKPDATTSVVRGFEVWTEQPDSSWRISRWISAPEPPAH